MPKKPALHPPPATHNATQRILARFLDGCDDGIWRQYTGEELAKELKINPSTVRGILKKLLKKRVLGRGVQRKYVLTSKEVGEKYLDGYRALQSPRSTPTPPLLTVHGTQLPPLGTPAELMEVPGVDSLAPRGMMQRAPIERVRQPDYNRDPAEQWTYQGDLVRVTVSGRNGKTVLRILPEGVGKAWHLEVARYFPELAGEVNRLHDQEEKVVRVHATTSIPCLATYTFDLANGDSISVDKGSQNPGGDLEAHATLERAKQIAGQMMIRNNAEYIAIRDQLVAVVIGIEKQNQHLVESNRELIRSNAALMRATTALMERVKGQEGSSEPGGMHG